MTYTNPAPPQPPFPPPGTDSQDSMAKMQDSNLKIDPSNPHFYDVKRLPGSWEGIGQ